MYLYSNHKLLSKRHGLCFSPPCYFRPVGHHLASCPSHNSPSARFMAKSDLLCQFPLDSLFCSYSCRRLQQHRPGDLPSETTLFNMLTCEKDRTEAGSRACYQVAALASTPPHTLFCPCTRALQGQVPRIIPPGATCWNYSGPTSRVAGKRFIVSTLAGGVVRYGVDM